MKRQKIPPVESETGAALARRWGVSPALIVKYRHEKMPRLPNGRYNSAVCDAWRASHKDSSRGPTFEKRGLPPPRGVHDSAADLLHTKAKRARVDLRRVEREEELAIGAVVAVQEIYGRVDGLIRNARSKLLSLGHGLGPRVAIESDPLKCTAMIDDAVREVLGELEAYRGEVRE